MCTDIGGIAGFSSGTLQSCVNTGAVGYAHEGYNIGGIVGQQSGYLNGCTNSGMIWAGRMWAALPDSWCRRCVCSTLRARLATCWMNWTCCETDRPDQ